MGVKERRHREKEARNELIKECASKLLARNGFKNTTIEDIAKKAELSKGTVYLYFRSKEELFFSIVEPILIAHGRHLVKKTRDKRERADVTLKKITELVFENYMESPEVFHLIWRYKSMDHKKLMKAEKLKRLRKLMKSNLKQTEKVIARGIEQNIFAPSLDPKITSIIYWNIFMGVIQFQENRLDDKGKDYRKSTLDLAFIIFLNGLKSKNNEN